MHSGGHAQNLVFWLLDCAREFARDSASNSVTMSFINISSANVADNSVPLVCGLESLDMPLSPDRIELLVTILRSVCSLP